MTGLAIEQQGTVSEENIFVCSFSNPKVCIVIAALVLRIKNTQSQQGNPQYFWQPVWFCYRNRSNLKTKTKLIYCSWYFRRKPLVICVISYLSFDSSPYLCIHFLDRYIRAAGLGLSFPSQKYQDIRTSNTFKSLWKNTRILNYICPQQNIIQTLSYKQ